MTNNIGLTKDQAAQVRATAANAGLDGPSTNNLVQEVHADLTSTLGKHGLRQISPRHVAASINKILARGK